MRCCIAPGTATDYTNVNSLPGRNIGDGQVSERDDFQVQQGARLDQEAKGVKERETTDATTAGYRRTPATSTDAISTEFSVDTGSGSISPPAWAPGLLEVSARP